MDSATIGAMASLATAVIVAVTAFAALRQIRHNHMANELQVHLHFVNEVNSAEMREAIPWTYEIAEKLKDPAQRERFVHGPQNENRDRFFRVVRFFERYASLVIVSGLSERLIFHEYAGMISQVWDNLYEAFPLMRSMRGRSSYSGRAFEHLAMRAKKYAAEQLPRDYAALERDPRLVALEARALAARDATGA